MAEVLIKYKADAGDLEATVNKINEVNNEAVKSAQKSATAISEAYKGAYKNAESAFRAGFVEKAIQGQITLVQALGKAGTALKPLANSLDETTKRLKIIVQSEDDVKKLEDRLRKLSLEGKRNTEEFQTIAQAVGEYKSAIIAADRAVDLYAKQTDAATGRIGELEDKLYDLALAGQTNSQEFKDLVKEVAVFKRAIVETDAQVDALTQRGARFTGFIQSVELVGNAFQAVEGAAALFGEENEELQKTLVRLQAIMAITSAIEQGRVIITEQLAAKTGIAAVATKLYAAATAGATAATVALRVAIAATGVGLLITGIALLVDRLRDAADNQAAFNRSLELSKKAAEGSRKAIQELQNQQLDLATRYKLAAGSITQAEADKQKLIEETTKTVTDNIKIEQDAQKKNNEQLQRLSSQLAEVEASNAAAVRSTRETARVQDTKGLKEQIAIQESELKASQFREETLTILKNQTISDINRTFAREDQKERDEEAKKAAEDRAKAAEEAAKRELEIRNEARKKLAELELQALATQLDEREKVLSESNAKIQELEQAFIDSKFKKGSDEEVKLQNAITLIKEDATKQIAAIDQKALEDKAAKEKEADEKLAAETLRIRVQGLTDEINVLKAAEINEGSTLERRIKLIEKDGEKRIAEAENNAAAIELINAETQKAIREEQKKTNQQAIDQAFEVAQAVSDTLGSIIELQGIQSEKRIEAITAASEKEKEAILQSGATEKQKQDAIDALNKRTEQKVAAEKTKQAKADKAAAIFEATINAAAAVAKAAGNPIQTAIAIAAGAAQVAIIAATPIPKFKRGGMVGGRSHEAGGTLIEAERGEFVVNRNAVSRHRSELDALNTSSAAFKKLIDERYVRPALNYYMGKKERAINVNASLNSKSMEREIKGMRRDLKRNKTIVNFNGNDSRYSWHLN